jgi:hypothetical protein
LAWILQTNEEGRRRNEETAAGLPIAGFFSAFFILPSAF